MIGMLCKTHMHGCQLACTDSSHHCIMQVSSVLDHLGAGHVRPRLLRLDVLCAGRGRGRWIALLLRQWLSCPWSTQFTAHVWAISLSSSTCVPVPWRCTHTISMHVNEHFATYDVLSCSARNTYLRHVLDWSAHFVHGYSSHRIIPALRLHAAIAVATESSVDFMSGTIPIKKKHASNATAMLNKCRRMVWLSI